MEIKTADELQQLLNQALADYNELQKKYDEAATQSEAQLKNLQSKFDDLQKQLSDTFSANEALTAEIEKLSAKPEGIIKKVEDAVINLAEHFFHRNGKKYGFNYPKLTKAGQVITPVEVKASEALQDELIASGSSMIHEKPNA